VLEFGVEVDRDAVVSYPAAHAHADRGDLGLAAARLDHPDADAACARHRAQKTGRLPVVGQHIDL
jgi:hypothetical protein